MTEKVLLYSNFFFEIQIRQSKGMQEKYLSWVYGVDRKIYHSGETRDADQ